MESDLTFIWAGLIAFAVLAYLMLDGIDPGLRALPKARRASHPVITPATRRHSPEIPRVPHGI